jgi:hypothetical protein
VAFGHFYLALTNIEAGMMLIQADHEVIAADLDAHPEVITEGLQCLLRSEGFSGAYEDFRVFSRANPRATLADIRAFVADKYPAITGRSSNLSPGNYRTI